MLAQPLLRRPRAHASTAPAAQQRPPPPLLRTTVSTPHAAQRRSSPLQETSPRVTHVWSQQQGQLRPASMSSPPLQRTRSVSPPRTPVISADGRLDLAELADAQFKINARALLRVALARMRAHVRTAGALRKVMAALPEASRQGDSPSPSRRSPLLGMRRRAPASSSSCSSSDSELAAGGASARRSAAGPRPGPGDRALPFFEALRNALHGRLYLRGPSRAQCPSAPRSGLELPLRLPSRFTPNLGQKCGIEWGRTSSPSFERFFSRHPQQNQERK